MADDEHRPWKALSTAYKEGPKGATWYDFDAYRVVLLRPEPQRAWRISRLRQGGVRGQLMPDVKISELIRDVHTAARVAQGELPESALKQSPYRDRRRATFGRYLEHIDPDVQRLVADGWAGHTWGYLRLLTGSAVAREIASSPGGAPLVCALAMGFFLLPMRVRGYWRFVERLLRGPRKLALGAYGFPAVPSSVAALAKVPRASMGPLTLTHLRYALEHPALAKRCFHAERLSLPFLFFMNERLLDHAAPSLLKELEQSPVDGFAAQHAATDLRDTLDLAAQEDTYLGTVSSLAELAWLHDHWVRRAQARQLLRKGPLPPLPIKLHEHEREWIVPLSTYEELRDEGSAMHHCLGTLPIQEEAAAAGRFYAFSLLGAHRATLAIWRPKPNDSWQLYDLRGPWNKDAAPELHPVARQLIDRFRRHALAQGGVQLQLDLGAVGD